MTLSFRESLERDVWNWQEAVLKTSYGLDWSAYLPKGMTKAQAQDEAFLRSYLQKEFYGPGKVAAFRAWLDEHLDIQQVESDLEGLMGKKFRPDTITVYLTTFQRAPYEIDERYFFLTVREKMPEIAPTAVYHELMHFHWYYWKTCEDAGLSESEIHDLKESLTVLLNPILKIRGLRPDYGYPKHKELRAQWVSLFEKEKDFPTFLAKALPLYKNSLVK